jgi:hypothetical protein
MELLGDVGHVESPFGPFGDSVSFFLHDRCIVCAIRTVSSEIIWTHLIELLGGVGQVESPFGHFGDSVSFSA